jgi:GLPGLI family protein
MRTFFVATFLLFSFSSFAQPKIITQAIVYTSTNVIAPEDEDVQNLQNNPSDGRMNFRNIMDGETKSTTWLKNDMVKTLLKSDMGRSTIIRNNSTKITTTLLEIMGNKTGFFASDSEQTELRKKADSMMQARKKTDSGSTEVQHRVEPTSEVVDAGETKKIAGYICKKAYLVTTRILGVKDTVNVWYTPEIKLQNVSSTGGLSGFGNMGSVNGFNKIDGFVMRYEMSMRRNRKMEVEVTKIDLGKDIADKEFDIPKDFDLKPIKEMQNMFGGGRGNFQMGRPGQ